MARDPVEREGEDELPRACRPAKRRFRVPHALACADHSPKYVGKPWPSGVDRGVEPALGVDLSTTEIRRDRRRAP